MSPIDRHEKIALSFSGGKDSLACVYLLRPHLDRITLYHNDTGDLLPEIQEIVEHVKSFAPNFVHMRTDVGAWIKQHGLPTDLLPFNSHPVGVAAGQDGLYLSARYECCFANLMAPTDARIRADGNTLVIRGTKRCDLKRLPAQSGDEHDGLELFHPLDDWSHDDVFSYLRSVGAPISRVYEHTVNSPECARCSAWWSEGRAAYLKRFHPALFEEYRSRLMAVAYEVERSLVHLRVELKEMADG